MRNRSVVIPVVVAFIDPLSGRTPHDGAGLSLIFNISFGVYSNVDCRVVEHDCRRIIIFAVTSATRHVAFVPIVMRLPRDMSPDVIAHRRR